MLVLNRKVSERIFIGDFAVITVVRIGPNSVRIGIDADPSINIAREEVAQSKPQADEDRCVSVE